MEDLIQQVATIMPTALTGSVVRTEGITAAVAGFPAPVGALVEIERQAGPAIQAEVIGFRDDLTLLFPHGEMVGVRRGNRVRLVRTSRFVRVGPALLGRVLDGRGRAIDGLPDPILEQRTPLVRRAPAAVQRPRIDTPLSTGVRSIDCLLTCGRGQRIGLFAGAGVGKSVTLGMMARNTSADVNVIALIGERGREVREFLERDLGPEGLARSVVVVATSDEPALVRVQAAQAATAIAEYFRDQNRDVLLIMDSLTRFAMAQREIGLAAGEPPTTKGYPPSVFALLPRLVERAGRSEQGSITAFYSVLVEGDDLTDPVGDAVRSLLDGHTVLSRRLAGRGHYPAVDVLESISRVMTDIISPEHLSAALAVRRVMSAHREHEDLLSIGAYRSGSNPLVDLAVALQTEIETLLRQGINERAALDDSLARLQVLAQRCQAGKPPIAAAKTDNVRPAVPRQG